MSRSILGIDIDEIIKKVLVETFPAQTEKEIQNSKTAELKQIKNSSSKSSDEKEAIDEDEKENKDIKAEDVVELFNQLRSGKSLKGKEIRTQFQAYFNALDGVERLALHTYVKAISDIVSGANSEKESANEIQPEDLGIDTTQDKKKAKKSKEKTKKVSKDDSTPIVVGEAANKARELGILRELK